MVVLDAKNIEARRVTLSGSLLLVRDARSRGVFVRLASPKFF